MPRRSFRSRAEVDAYLSTDRIVCLECGRSFASLAHHLRRAHDQLPDQYRRRWGLPAGTPLAGQGYRHTRRLILRDKIATGNIVPNPARASMAARRHGRGTRVEWDRAEQAERMRAHAPRPTLISGERRADGRDATRARLYQRAHRALKRGNPLPMKQYRAQYNL